MTEYERAVERVRQAEARLRLAYWQRRQGHISQLGLEYYLRDLNLARTELEQAILDDQK